MIPLGRHVEAIAEATTRFQAQIVERCRAGVGGPFLFPPRGRAAEGRTFGVERTLAEMELLGLFIPAVERLEDRPMQVFQRLIAPDLDRAAISLAGRRVHRTVDNVGR